MCDNRGLLQPLERFFMLEQRTAQIKAKAQHLYQTLLNFDYSKIKNIKKEDIIRVCSYKKTKQIIVALLVLTTAGYVVKDYIIAPYLKDHFALPVNVIEVTSQNVPYNTSMVGQTRSPQAVEIYTRVSGFLDKQVYTEGSWVKAGDILFEIDKKPFIAQLEAAKAALVSQEAALRTATLTLDRIKPLAAAKALSQQNLDDATGEYLRAKAGVDQAKANVQTAQLNLDYCTIRSPIDGLASVREVALGTYIQPGSANSRLTQVNQMNPMWVYFSVAEDEMLKLNQMVQDNRLKKTPIQDLEIELELTNGTVYPYLGKISFSDILYNVDTGTQLFRAVFDNPKNQLQQGQFVTVHVKGLVQPDAILVPQASVQQSKRGSYVWVVDKENHVQMRTVETGPWSGPNWVIEKGLKTGDRVVVSNVLRMSDEQLVKPTTVPAPSVKKEEAKQPKPPVAEQPTNDPYAPGTPIPKEMNVPPAETPKEEPMPTPPAPTPELIAPIEKPIKKGVPKKATPIPKTLETPTTENTNDKE